MQNVDVHVTLAGSVTIIVFTEPNNAASISSFVFLTVKAFNSIECWEELFKNFQIVVFPNLYDNEDGTAMLKVPLTYKQENKYTVAISNNDNTLIMISHYIAKCFMHITKNYVSDVKNSEECAFQFVFNIGLNPLNYYLIDLGTAKVLHTLCSSYERASQLMIKN